MASTIPIDPPHDQTAPSGITVRERADGGTEFILPAWRNFGEKITFSLGWLVMGGCLAVSLFINDQVVEHLPGFLHFLVAGATHGYIYVLGAIELLLTLFCLNLWLRSSRIIATPEALKIITHWAFIKRTVTIPTAKIIELKAVNNATADTTRYYDIVVLSTGEKKSWLAQHTAPAVWYTENEVKAFNTGGKNMTLAAGLEGEAAAQWLLGKLRATSKINV